MADIAGDKDPRHARLKIKRLATGRPSGRQLAFAHQMLAGNKIPLRVTFNNSRERQSCSRNRPSVNQQRARRNFFRRARLVILNREGFCSARFLPTAMTFELNFTAIFFVAVIWFSKYCDMLSDKELPRTTIVTCRANFEKYIASPAPPNSRRRQYIYVAVTMRKRL